MWVLPGGGIDPGELPQNAATREALEETGLQVSITRKVALYTPINRLSNETHVYECIAIKGKPSLGDETLDIGYFALNNLPHPFFFIHHDWLNDALRNAPFLITEKLHKITYFRLLSYFFRHPLQVLRFALSRLGLPLNSK